MKKRLLNISDWNTIATNFSSIQTYMDTSASGINNLLSRMTSAEGNITSMLSRLSTAEGSITSLLSRMTAAEGSISSHTTTIGSHTTDINALKAWRAAKATASPDVSTSFSVATDVITLGLAAPRASSINSIVATIMGEINGLKAILRSREILAT